MNPSAISIGLSDLLAWGSFTRSPAGYAGIHLVFQTCVKCGISRHSPALRFGLCWYPIGLSDLFWQQSRDHTSWDDDHAPAPTGRRDTSIARRAMNSCPTNKKV
jgi:hypothetical protein